MAKICDEAKRISYDAGISALAPVVQRIIDLEQQVSALAAAMESLKKSGTPAHLRNMEKRAGT
jgi:hypothetical protein